MMKFTTLLVIAALLVLSGMASEQATANRGLALNAVGNKRITPALRLQTPCVPAPSGAVSWWTGDGNSNDSIGGNHGMLQNGATFAPGLVGQAFSFDGINDYVKVASSPTLQFGTGDFTIDFWARILDPFGNAHAMVTTQPVNTDPPGILIVSRGISPPANTIMFDIADGGNKQTITVPVPTDLQFHHFAFRRSGTDIKGYVDGVDQTTVLTAAGVANMDSPADLLFGRNGLSSSAGHYFAGQLDEIEIFNRALSASEIQAIYSAGSAGKCKFLAVDIDIKPGSFPNSINPGSNGVIPVAILTTPTFNAATVNASTVRFGANGSEAAVAQSTMQDVDGDGDLDRLLHFRTQRTGITCGATAASLTGKTFNGQMFKGTDSVVTVGCN